MEKYQHLEIAQLSDLERVSFDDLIDAAVQAKKDGVCENVEINADNWLIVKAESGNISAHKNHSDSCNKFHIEWIESLYAEEFVIETMSDELKVKSGAEVTLANGIKCTYFDDGRRKLRHDGDFYDSSFLLLKGAKVKQSKKD